jgi:antitoxin FitA
VKSDRDDHADDPQHRCGIEMKERVRVRAARDGRSMEGDLRYILREALGDTRKDRESNLAEAIRRRFLPLGGVDKLELHPRYR